MIFELINQWTEDRSCADVVAGLIASGPQGHETSGVDSRAIIQLFEGALCSKNN